MTKPSTDSWWMQTAWGALYKKRLEAGICVECGQLEVKVGQVRCDRCRKRNLERTKAAQRREVLAAERGRRVKEKTTPLWKRIINKREK